MTNIQELKGYIAIKELVERELNNYGYFKIGELQWNNNYGFEEDDEHNFPTEHYKINITKQDDTIKTLYFNFNKEDEKIEIELGEDCWEEVRDYDNKIKYFWMALLEW